MRTFKTQLPNHPHFMRPGAPTRSNAAPTLGFRERGQVLGIGSTGSERMVSGMFTTLLRLGTSSPLEAVAGPRLHATPEGLVKIERDRFRPEAVAALEDAGFTLEDLGPYSFQAGGLQLARVDEDDRFHGVADPRRDGSASGPIP